MHDTSASQAALIQTMQGLLASRPWQMTRYTIDSLLTRHGAYWGRQQTSNACLMHVQGDDRLPAVPHLGKMIRRYQTRPDSSSAYVKSLSSMAPDAAETTTPISMSSTHGELLDLETGVVVSASSLPMAIQML